MKLPLAAAALALVPLVALGQQTDGALPAKLAVVGRVVDADGRPVAGASVWADNGGSYQVMKSWTEAPWRSLVPDPLASADVGPFTVRGREPTGADGAFRVDGVSPPAGAGWVLVVHPDHPATRVDVRGAAVAGVVDAGDVRLEAGSAVTATVTAADGTAPVAGAWVVARPASHEPGRGNWWSAETPGEIRAGRTAADGTCTLRGLRAQEYRVAAFTAASRPAEVRVTPQPRATAACRIALAAGASVRVEVVTRGTGRPVEGARVVLDRPSEGGMSFPAPPPLGSLRTDAAGVAQFAGLEEIPEFAVGAVPPDFASDTVHHPGPFHVGGVVKPGGTIRLEMDAPRTLVVRVVDAYTKRPVPGATLKLWAHWDRYDRTGGSPVDLEPAWDAVAGTYMTARIRPGPWTVGAFAPGWLPGGATNVVVPAEGEVPVEVVELIPASAAAAGRVVAAATGEPVPGASVTSYEWVERLAAGQRAAATAAADGTFQLSPLLGARFPLHVDVRADGFCPEFLRWTKAARPEEVGTVRLTRAATIRGRVADGDGRPLARVEVVLVQADFPQRGKGDGWSATTDDTGRFAFSELRPGAYLLGGRSGVRVTVAEGETAERDVVR